MCEEKEFVKFDLSSTTLHVTIAWLENGVIKRYVYTSDSNASKSGTTEFSSVRSSTTKA